MNKKPLFGLTLLFAICMMALTAYSIEQVGGSDIDSMIGGMIGFILITLVGIFGALCSNY